MKLERIYELQGNTGATYIAYKQATDSEDYDRISKKIAERIKWFDKKGLTGDKETDQATQLMEDSS